MAVTIRSNAATTYPVVIHDCGWTVPAGGGSISVERFDDLQVLSYSRDLLTLTSDGTYGPGSHTLIVNDGSADIPQPQVEAFLQQAPYLDLLPYTFLRRKEDGGLPVKAGPYIVFSASRRVPSNGVLYLRLGEAACTSAGWVAGREFVLESISIRVSGVDSKNYRAIVVEAPGDGLESALGFVDLAAGNFDAHAEDLGGAIAVGDELGVRVDRTSGAGQSDFTSITVVVEVR